MLYFMTVLYTIVLLIRPQEFVPALTRIPLLQLIVLFALPIAALTGNKEVSLEKQRRSVPLLVAGAIVYSLIAIYTLIKLTTPEALGDDPAVRAPLMVALFSALATWCFIPHKGWELPQFKLVGPFFAVCALGMAINGWPGGVVFLMQTVLPPVLTALILSGAVRTVKQLRSYMVLLIGIACTIVLHGHLQVADPAGMGWSGSKAIEGRITYTGIFDDPNDIGLLLVISLAFTLHLFGATARKWLRLMLVLAGAWLVYGVVLTDSRGTMLASLVVFGFHVWRRYGKTTLVIGGLLAVPLLLLSSRLSQIDTEEESAAGRIDAWLEGIMMLRSDPLFGVGYGNFTEYNHLTAHNTLVLAFSELGLLGYILWLAIIGYSAYMIYWVTFKSKDWVLASGRSLPVAFATEISTARALLVASLGFGVGAFFLSQSFKPLIFMLCGLAMGRYLQVELLVGPLPPLSFLRDLKYWVGAALASILVIYGFVKVAA